MPSNLKIISTSSHPEFSKKVASHLNQGLTPTKLHKFSNENMMIKIKESVRGKDVFIISTQSSPVHKNLWELVLAIDAAKRASARRVTATIPCFPYARSDKKDQSRISIGARCVNTVLENCGADRVLTADLHAKQIQAFFSPHTQCDQLQGTKLICDYIKDNYNLKNCTLVAADAGAVKMVRKYQDCLGFPVAVIDKRRNRNEDKVVARGVVGDVENKNCVIIDDEVSSGSTLIEAAKLLKKEGADSVMAACIHPVLGANSPKKIQQSEIDKLITTDTVPTKDKEFEKLEVVSISNLFAQAIKRIHEGKSVSVLFNEE